MRKVTLALAVALLAGCAHVPYCPGRNIEMANTLQLAPGEPQFERGRRVALLDGTGHYVISLPSKLIL